LEVFLYCQIEEDPLKTFQHLSRRKEKAAMLVIQFGTV